MLREVSQFLVGIGRHRVADQLEDRQVVIAVGIGRTGGVIDLEAACKRYEEEYGGKKQLGGPGTAWTRWALRFVRSRRL